MYVAWTCKCTYACTGACICTCKCTHAGACTCTCMYTSMCIGTSVSASVRASDSDRTRTSARKSASTSANLETSLNTSTTTPNVDKRHTMYTSAHIRNEYYYDECTHHDYTSLTRARLRLLLQSHTLLPLLPHEFHDYYHQYQYHCYDYADLGKATTHTTKPLPRPLLLLSLQRIHRLPHTTTETRASASPCASAGALRLRARVGRGSRVSARAMQHHPSLFRAPDIYGR